MQARLRVDIDLSDLKRTHAGSIIGRIWFASGDDAFPEARWSDFVVVLLGWWIGELLRLRQGRTQAELVFMDGPYSIGLDAAQGEQWAFSFLRNEAAVRSMPGTVTTHGANFETDLATVAREVIAACDRHGWSGDLEVEKLARLLDEFGTS